MRVKTGIVLPKVDLVYLKMQEHSENSLDLYCNNFGSNIFLKFLFLLNIKYILNMDEMASSS